MTCWENAGIFSTKMLTLVPPVKCSKKHFLYLNVKLVKCILIIITDRYFSLVSILRLQIMLKFYLLPGLFVVSKFSCCINHKILFVLVPCYCISFSSLFSTCFSFTQYFWLWLFVKSFYSCIRVCFCCRKLWLFLNTYFLYSVSDWKSYPGLSVWR